MKKLITAFLISLLAISNVLSGCGKKTSDESEVSEAASVEKITLLNTKSEVATQMETLASKYAQETGITVEVALRYNTNYSERAYSFCNNIFTPDGGMHLDGFRRTLSSVINSYAKDNNLIKKDDVSLTNDDLKEGLTAIISVKHPDPQYEGQTKGKLGNAEVRPVVNKIFGDFLKRYLLFL